MSAVASEIRARDEFVALRAELAAIIAERQITVLFQPIISSGEGRIFGYEALTRGPADSPLHSPAALFDAAWSAGLITELEVVCWSSAYARFMELGLEGKLFLNTSPHSLLDRERRLLNALERIPGYPCRPERVVIEVTEQYPVGNFEAVRETIEAYRALGFSVAIDDLGAGYSGLRLWSELRPDFVKIDSHFLQEIHKDPVKQEFVRSIRDIALGTRCQVIAEGIESADEYRVLLKLGIPYGQGFWFARPSINPPLALTATLPDGGGNMTRLSEGVGSLATPAPTLTCGSTIEGAVELFRRHTDVNTLVVVDKGKIAGVVRRSRLMELFLSRYGRELHGKKAVCQFMEREPLVVEYNLPVERVSQKLTDMLEFEIDRDFVITREGQYAGLGRVRDLLKKITELQVRNARYANPLTLLPGNVPIHEQVELLLGEELPFAVCYCDLDNFKPFNDVYGYTQGDELIRKVAQVLSAHTDGSLDFVGHIGGDDFIVVFRSPDWVERCEHILRHFTREVPDFYTAEDNEQGGFWANDRGGRITFYPMVSLSIGAVVPDPARCTSHHAVAALATDAKRQAKKQVGSTLFVDRRQGPLESERLR